MGKFWVKRDGRVCSVFDTPFTDFDAPPDATPNDIIADSVEQLKGMYPQHELVIIERPARKEAPTSPRLPLAAILKMVAASGMGSDPKMAEILAAAEKKAATQPAAVDPQVTDAMTGPNMKVMGKESAYHAILQEFRILLATDRPAAEVVANFLVSACPDIEEQVMEIINKSGKKRIVL